MATPYYKPPAYVQPGSMEMESELRVGSLVNQLRTIKDFPPVVVLLRRSPADHQAFQQNLIHEYNVLRERSHRLRDHEMSIVQKAFVILMGDFSSRAGAIDLYLEEILGLKLVPIEDQVQSCQTSLKARNLVLHSMHLHLNLSRQRCPR